LPAESKLEEKARLFVEAHGGRLPKWTSPGNVGVPDRILLLYGCPVVFTEFKAPGEKLRPMQVHWQKLLCAMGFKHWVIDDFDEFVAAVEALIEVES